MQEIKKRRLIFLAIESDKTYPTHEINQEDAPSFLYINIFSYTVKQIWRGVKQWNRMKLQNNWVLVISLLKFKICSGNAKKVKALTKIQTPNK